MGGPRKLASHREHTGNRQLDAIQESARKTERRVNVCPFLDGVLRSVQFAAGTAKTVDHGLGTRATFIVARTNYDGSGAPSEINEANAAAQAPLDQANQLSVIADINCTVDLWFYPVVSEGVPR